MDASKAIKYMLVDTGIKEAELARRVGIAPQNLNTRLKSPQNWRIDDLARLAAACGAVLDCSIRLPSGDLLAITPHDAISPSSAPASPSPADPTDASGNA